MSSVKQDNSGFLLPRV